jgi:signal transduction histidine kinase
MMRVGEAPAALVSILECLSAFGDRFTDLPKRFEEDHASYIGWLRDEFRKTLRDKKVHTALLSFKVDWVTLHYNSRHPAPVGATRADWLQVGFPVSPSMQKYGGALLVNRRTTPPYLRFTGNVMQGSSVVILLTDEEHPRQPTEANFLAIGKTFSQVLAKITKGEEPQNEIDSEDVSKCREIAGDELVGIRERLAKWSGSKPDTFSEEAALILLRNICRVTFLILRFRESEVALPRFVVLSPVHTGNNLIGGIAFIGPLVPEADSSRVTTLRLLHLMAHTLLTNVRLREEPYVHERARGADELNRARAAFVQRMAHSLQTPLESLLLNIQGSIESLQKIAGRVKDLQVAAGDVMLAFTRDNVDALLKIEKVSINIYDFLDTLRFMNAKRYEKEGKKLLQLVPIPKDWTLWADKTAFWEVIDNLLNNAVRFARQEVVVSVKRFGQNGSLWYRFSVKDDGDGIDPVVRPHLFKPGSGKATEEPEGSPHGYGLYLSQRVVNLHGGRMYLNDADGAGTEFVVEIPEGLPSSEEKESI